MSLLLYLMGLAILFTGIYFVRKSDEKLNAVTYLVFTAVLFMIVQVVEAGIISRIPGIPVNAVAFGVVHIAEGAALWYVILVKKYRQMYYFDIADVRVLAVLAVFVVVVAVRQFGVRLDNFNFEADSDAARHYMYACSAADHGQLVGMYFSAVNSGMLMNACEGLIRGISRYRLFLLFEIFVLYLNGAMFWTLIRRYLRTGFSVLMGVVLTAAYMLGYPWNSMVYGSAYLSTGILCVAMLIFLLDMYYNDIFCAKKITLVLMLASCYSVLVSYSLFVPPVMGIIILTVILKWIKERELSWKKVCSIVVPAIVVCLTGGLFFLYLWLIRGTFDSFVGVLSWWGCSYSTLYADFLFVIPFVIFWIVKSLKTRTVNIESIVLVVFLLYTLVLFVGNHFGKISAYYYYKMYTILWIAAFMIAAVSIVNLKKDIFVFGYMVMWGGLFAIYISSAESSLPQKYNLKLVDESAAVLASDFFTLYDHNIIYGGRDKISKAAKELYMEAAELSLRTKQFIPYIGEYKDAEWTYFALAGLPHQDVLSGKNYGAAIEELKKYPYVLSVECEEPMINISRFLSTLPVVYENEAGKIYKVENIPVDYRSDDIHVDIMLRYGLPKLERMGWVEQDEYVNSLQVIQKIEELGLDKDEFLYPELQMEKIQGWVSYLTDGHYHNRKEVVFTGTTSQELQQAINDYPGALIDIRSKQIVLNETIILRNNTAIRGNGVRLTGTDLEYGFTGDELSDLYLNGLCIEGDINYGIYLTDCSEISISECRIHGLRQKAVCIIGDTKKIAVYGNEICGNNAGGIHIAGNVSEGLLEDNNILNNGGTSKWMSGIVLTGIVSENKYDIWDGFDAEYHFIKRNSVYAQNDCPNELIIRCNQISGNGALGIYSDGAYKGYVVGNTINQNAGGGISIDYGTLGFYMEGNYLDSNGAAVYPGITLDNAAYNIVRNNIITNHPVGINMVQASARNVIMENVVQGGGNEVCHQYGIVVGTQIGENEKKDDGSSYENVICRNSIMGNHNVGIFVDEGCYVNDVFDNVIMEVKTFSIEAVSSMFNSIINNTSNASEWNAYQQ